MTATRIRRSVLAVCCHRPDRNAPAIITAVLLMGAVAFGGSMASPAHAASIQVTTTGTISSGSDPINLFGTGNTNLASDRYTLTAFYFGLGPFYFTSGSGTSASDFDPLTGSVTATVNGHSVTTQLLNTTDATLVEDLYDLLSSNMGMDGTGAYANFSQTISCGNQCVPNADLKTNFGYSLQAGDFGSDLYTFQPPGNPFGQTVTFFGDPTSVSFTVPEPASAGLLAVGLLGLGVLGRRRRA